MLLPNERRIGKTSRGQELNINEPRSQKHRKKDKEEQQRRRGEKKSGPTKITNLRHKEETNQKIVSLESLWIFAASQVSSSSGGIEYLQDKDMSQDGIDARIQASFRWGSHHSAGKRDRGGIIERGKYKGYGGLRRTEKKHLGPRQKREPTQGFKERQSILTAS